MVSSLFSTKIQQTLEPHSKEINLHYAFFCTYVAVDFSLFTVVKLTIKVELIHFS